MVLSVSLTFGVGLFQNGRQNQVAVNESDTYIYVVSHEMIMDQSCGFKGSGYLLKDTLFSEVVKISSLSLEALTSHQSAC